MDLVTLHTDLRHHGKSNVKFLGTKGSNLSIAAWLLAGKIVTGKPNDHKILLTIFPV